MDKAAENLEKAFKSLKKEETKPDPDPTPDPDPGAADVSGLKNLYEAYKDIKSDGYTAESWAAFDKARAEAEKILANPNATQDDVNAAKAALEAAYKGLVPKTQAESEHRAETAETWTAQRLSQETAQISQDI